MAMAKNKTNVNGIVNDLYLATLNRPARATEIAKINNGLKMRTKDKNPMDPYQDLFWALLNSNEFLLNH
jgi:hypothetical protein